MIDQSKHHRAKGFLHVQLQMGHGSVPITMLCTQWVDFESGDYHVKTAESLREGEELVSAGFGYVTERGGVKIYRKRK